MLLKEIYMDSRKKIENDDSTLLKGAKLQVLKGIYEWAMEQYDYKTFPELAEIAFRKRCELMCSATTLEELGDFCFPSRPAFNGTEYVPMYSYHIEEEELLIWQGMLDLDFCKDPAAKDRINKLAQKLFPDTDKYRAV